MDLIELTQKASELRSRFAQLENNTCGRQWNRAELMAAFMTDIGQLSKLIMAKEGLRKDYQASDEKLSHQLADCLWCILTLAADYNINLEQSLLSMIQNDEAKVEQLLNKDN